MKALNSNSLLSSLILKSLIKPGYPITLKNPSTGRGTRLRTAKGGGTRTTTRNRRNRRRNKGAGIEINKASGGYKSIIYTGAVRHLAINEYGRLMLVKAGASYSYAITLKRESYSTNRTSIDLSAILNESEEYNEWCQCASQYKVYGVRITIDYARVPEAGDTLSRLLLSVKADKADVQDSKIERNVMNLDMSATGVKNFNFNLNRKNTEVAHLGWTDTTEYYSAVLQMKIEGQDITMLKDTTPDAVFLGTIKISFMTKLRLRDYIPGNNKSTPLLRKKKVELYELNGDLVGSNGKKYREIIEEVDAKLEEDKESQVCNSSLQKAPEEPKGDLGGALEENLEVNFSNLNIGNDVLSEHLNRDS
jgi:hypothetical protein